MTMRALYEQLTRMGLHGMAANLQEQGSNSTYTGMSFEERMGYMVDQEEHLREKSKRERMMRQSKVKLQVHPEQVDLAAKRGLDSAVWRGLLNCSWIDNALNLVVTGPTGVGKSFLAYALIVQAILRGMPALYWRWPLLVEQIEIASADGRIPRLRAQLTKPRLLVIDDWAMSPMTARARQEIFEIVDARQGVGSLLLTSQLPIDAWHDYIAEPTVADAILDRIIHSAHRISLHGESLRKRHADQ
jgi:DNA replication protein DnaC